MAVKKGVDGLVIWLTGLPCSGKTTLAEELAKYFKRKSFPLQILDGDIIRKTICNDLGFSRKDRDKNIERTAHVAALLAQNGVNVIAAFVSPYRRMRKFARRVCPRFIEVYVKCSLQECINRDVKGMYRKALQGELVSFTGVQDPYEEPRNPEIILETDKKSLEENLTELIDFISKFD